MTEGHFLDRKDCPITNQILDPLKKDRYQEYPAKMI